MRIHWKFTIVLMAAAAAIPACSGPNANVAGQPGSANRAQQPIYDCRPATGTIVVDGAIDEPAWQNAPFSDVFLCDTFAVAAGKARQLPDKLTTRMKTLYDSANLYVAIECEDSDIWASFAKHDDPIHFEKAALLNLDPLGNGRDYYGIYVNPLNAVLDLRSIGGRGQVSRKRWMESIRWNAKGVEHAVKVDGTINRRDDVDNKWTVELRVPFDDLGVRPMQGDTWRVNVGRMDYWLGSIIVSSWASAEFGTLVFK